MFYGDKVFYSIDVPVIAVFIWDIVQWWIVSEHEAAMIIVLNFLYYFQHWIYYDQYFFLLN